MTDGSPVPMEKLPAGSLRASGAWRSLARLRKVATPADKRAFEELERELLARRWRLFGPIIAGAFVVLELAAHVSPEFPKAPLLTAAAVALMVGMYLLGRLRPGRAVIGWATVFTGIACAAYVATASAETGRYHSLHVLGMAVLISMLPAVLSLSLAESIVAFAGSILAWVGVCRVWMVDGPVDYAGLPTAVVYLLIMAVVMVVTTSSNQRLRFREFVALREVERTHRFAVEEVLCRHLPPRYVERVLSGDHPLDSPPERRRMTMLFADLVSFTPLSEELAPEELAALMARFYDVAATVAFEHGATMDKFIGDAVMALLGAPDRWSQRSRRAARWRWRAPGTARWAELSWPGADGRKLVLRIGIHQDVVAVGAFGGRMRSDYTVLGRGVNLAARLEQSCPPGEILVSAELLRQLVTPEQGARDLGELSLKGIPKPVRTWSLKPGGEGG